MYFELCKAARGGAAEPTRDALACHHSDTSTDVNEGDSNESGLTALHLAAKSGMTEISEALISNGQGA